MLNAFQKHLTNNLPELFKSKIAIAISGGVDSVVLAHLCSVLHINISLLHCNFQLREAESDQDQLFVKQFSEKLSAPFITTNFDTTDYIKANKVSTQIAARELRYDWFAKMAKLYSFKAVLTAHHLDDNLETFVINLSRGSGLEGLTAIPEKNGLYIRPLLQFSKKQIIAYAENNNINWREDASNQETKYLRNKIRHNTVPSLEALSPTFKANFANTISHLKQSQEVVKAYVEQVKKNVVINDKTINGFKISIEALKQEGHIDLVLFEILKEFKFSAWHDIKSLLNAQSGKKIHSESYTLLKDREFLLVYPLKEQDAISVTINEKQTSAALSQQEIVIISESEIQVENSNSLVALDKKKLKFPLVVRKWQQGDYFYPTGMSGKKKLSKYFKDEKLSLLEKEKTWLLCSDSQIVWVINRRLDRRFIATQESHKLWVNYQKE